MNAALTAEGILLAEDQWTSMLAGSSPGNTDPATLRAVANYFQVDSAYLLEPKLEGIIDEIDARLVLERALRETNTEVGCMRALGAIEPDALRSVAAALSNVLEHGPRGSLTPRRLPHPEPDRPTGSPRPAPQEPSLNQAPVTSELTRVVESLFPAAAARICGITAIGGIGAYCGIAWPRSSQLAGPSADGSTTHLLGVVRSCLS